MARIASALAYVAILVPLAGCWSASGLIARIPKFEYWTTAWIHTLAVAVFAVILLMSTLVNAAIISARLRKPPPAYSRLLRLPLALLLTDALGVVWVEAIATATVEWSNLEPICALAMALTSIATFVLAMRPDDRAIADRDRHVLEAIEASLLLPLRPTATKESKQP